MKHNNVVSILKKRIQEPLPGTAAQLKKAPEIRAEQINRFKTAIHARQSAVLLLLYPISSNSEVVFVERTTYEGTHSGQIGLPGGKKEKIDQAMSDTALRETQEEIGIDKNEITLIGSLTPLYIPISNFQVHPFVGFLSISPKFTPEPTEVRKIITFPVADLLQSEISKRNDMEIRGRVYEVPYFDVMGHVVWGATAMILSEFVELFKRV